VETPRGFVLAGGKGAFSRFGVVVIHLGVLLLIAAVKTLRTEDDPDAPPPKWMRMVDSATPLQTFGLGAIFTLVAAKLWVFTLSAIGVIRESNLGSPSENLTAFLIYVLGAESLLILPLLVYAIAPRQSAGLLQTATHWLETYNRPITITVSLIFGCFFLWKGISGLLL
jgi:hypothetical protein